MGIRTRKEEKEEMTQARKQRKCNGRGRKGRLCKQEERDYAAEKEKDLKGSQQGEKEMAE